MKKLKEVEAALREDLVCVCRQLEYYGDALCQALVLKTQAAIMASIDGMGNSKKAVRARNAMLASRQVERLGDGVPRMRHVIALRLEHDKLLEGWNAVRKENPNLALAFFYFNDRLVRRFELAREGVEMPESLRDTEERDRKLHQYLYDLLIHKKATLH